MKALVACSIAAGLLVPAVSFAAQACPDRTPAAIMAPSGQGGKDCQAAIAKAASGFVKAKLKTDGKCMSRQEPGECPNSKDTAKVQKAALKARDAIAKACGDTATVSQLTSSYASLPTGELGAISSCTLSQHNATSAVLLGIVNGTPGRIVSNKERDKCVKTLNSAGIKYALGVLSAINKCVAAQLKAGATGDLADECVGHYAGGSLVPPSDQKTADKIAGLITKTEDSVGKACGPVNAFNLKTIFACPGASSVDDLKKCLVCEGWDKTLDVVQQQYSESATYVAFAAGALQSAVTAAAPGTKMLIESGEYEEQINIPLGKDGLQFVGCGGATDDRPNIEPPTSGGPYPNGIFAADVDGLVFQSLKVSGGWNENGIFVTGADGVTFRDVIADGADDTPACIGGANDGMACDAASDCPNGVCTPAVSTYGIFPVQSNNVLVEVSKAVNIRDAGIYVGQCTNMVVRYNTAVDNVAGIEIENSTGASVHNNYSANNVGGLLVFKLPDPLVQRGQGHEVFFNVILDNNTSPNFGIPNTTVAGIPPGTGVVVMSVDACDFHHNIVQGNNSYGFAVIDQNAFDVLAGGAFGGAYSHTCAAPDAPYTKCDPGNVPPECPLSSSCVQDQKLSDNKIRDNEVTGNAGAPDPGAVLSQNILYGIFEEDPGGNNNCFANNNSATGAPLGNIFSLVCP